MFLDHQLPATNDCYFEMPTGVYEKPCSRVYWSADVLNHKFFDGSDPEHTLLYWYSMVDSTPVRLSNGRTGIRFDLNSWEHARRLFELSGIQWRIAGPVDVT